MDPSIVSSLEVIPTSYANSASHIFSIREQVFHREQNIDPALDMDGKDDTAQHFIAYWQQEPVGIARIRAYGQGNQVKIERVAVLPAFRHQGIGRAITMAALNYAQQQGFVTAVLYAQAQSASFYEQFGFQRQGTPFIQANISHIAMTKKL